MSAAGGGREAAGTHGRRPRKRPSDARRQHDAAARAPLLFAHVVPGVEDLAAAELREMGAEPTETLSGFDRRDSLVLFHAENIERVMRCGLLEDVFAAELDMPTPAGAATGKAAAAALAARLERPALERALVLHHALRPGRRGRSYRVIVRESGQHPFRRADVEKAFAGAIDRLLAKWVPAGAEGAAALELWVHVIGARTLVGVRLSDDRLAGRAYKTAHLPGSLKPTAARALVRLAGLRPGMTVVDPMCGAGTILREAAESARSLRLLGGDISEAALQAARENAGKQASLVAWDGTRVPLQDGVANAVIVNPPYGRRHEAGPGPQRLYAGMLREAARILGSGGVCVVLTGAPQELLAAMRPRMQVRERRRIVLRGLPVTAFVIVRT